MALCPFKGKYLDALREHFPGVDVIEGTHAPHISHDEFKDEVRELFCQGRRTMTDVILGRQYD